MATMEASSGIQVMENQNKICLCCGIEKPIKKFHTKTHCKVCYNKEYRLTHKNEIMVKNNEYNKFHKMSIDRIDISNGYTKENIRLLSLWANIARYTSTDEQFKANCKPIIEHNRTL